MEGVGGSPALQGPPEMCAAHLKGCESTGWCPPCEVTRSCLGTGVKPTEKLTEGVERGGLGQPQHRAEMRGARRTGTGSEKPQSMGLRGKVANAAW